MCIRDSFLVGGEADAQARMRHLGMGLDPGDHLHDLGDARLVVGAQKRRAVREDHVLALVLQDVGELPDTDCLLYTSDAADEEDSVGLGGSRIFKKKKKDQETESYTHVTRQTKKIKNKASRDKEIIKGNSSK